LPRDAAVHSAVYMYAVARMSGETRLRTVVLPSPFFYFCSFLCVIAPLTDVINYVFAFVFAVLLPVLVIGEVS